MRDKTGRSQTYESQVPGKKIRRRAIEYQLVRAIKRSGVVKLPGCTAIDTGNIRGNSHTNIHCYGSVQLHIECLILGHLGFAVSIEAGHRTRVLITRSMGEEDNLANHPPVTLRVMADYS